MVTQQLADEVQLDKLEERQKMLVLHLMERRSKKASIH